MEIKSIPTVYRGAQFRSRLEARWAAFFDLATWRWDYEPCDFEAWIPDFVLFGPSGPVYVEVKPIYFAPWVKGEDCLAQIKPFCEIEKVNLHQDIDRMVLGNGPQFFDFGDFQSPPILGIEWIKGKQDIVHFTDTVSSQIGFAGFNESKEVGKSTRIPNMWLQAGSATQWNR